MLPRPIVALNGGRGKLGVREETERCSSGAERRGLHAELLLGGLTAVKVKVKMKVR